MKISAFLSYSLLRKWELNSVIFGFDSRIVSNLKALLILLAPCLWMQQAEIKVLFRISQSNPVSWRRKKGFD